MLTKEQIWTRKQSLLKGKELLSGKAGEEMFGSLLDYIDTIEYQYTQIEQLQAKLDLCKEALHECKAYQMMPSEIDEIVYKALQAIEKI
jgi:hypothetical protein